MEHDNEQQARARSLICGGVQGVGFRPFVYRLAKELGLAGWVSNTPQGVTLEVEGEHSLIEKFLLKIEKEKPPLSFIQSMQTLWIAPLGAQIFEIRESHAMGKKTAFLLPDIATCSDCLRELFDPANRRFAYPFTNCTHCGPRFSIVTALPYDRENTSMHSFTMCEECQREYNEPSNRRFHAQPNACPACGPHLEWWNPEGVILASQQEALRSATKAIQEGAIVSVKGLGGFHLMVDAGNQDAIERLRRVKHREEKPFAIMAPSLKSASEECEISELEECLLCSPEAPIVLLKRHRTSGSVTPGVAPGNPLLGIMLPYTPLHHLLMKQLSRPVVATSGNRAEEPICTDEFDALERLRGIADFHLVHNRPIVRHVDDSIVRVMMGRASIMRRARGYAPLPINLKSRRKSMLALGAHMKNTVALSVDKSVFISQHLGDLETPAALAAFHETLTDFQHLYDTTPSIVAADSHSEYLSTKAASELTKKTGARLVSVQHHHAHILSCMADNQIIPPVLGVAWDGTGYGLDGTIWGGEFFRITPTSIERFANLRPFPLPGGEAAAREPRRCALGLLYSIFGAEVFQMNDLIPIQAFSLAEKNAMKMMLQRKINTPLTSSMGRFFDAMASLAGIRQHSSFEGQSAMEWEWIAEKVETLSTYPLEMRRTEDSTSILIDWEPMVLGFISDLQAGMLPATLSQKFHSTLVEMIVQLAKLSGLSQIALSGGCFQNERLLTSAVNRLQHNGFSPFWHQRVPPNDGGISLGQIAAVEMDISNTKKNF